MCCLTYCPCCNWQTESAQVLSQWGTGSGYLTAVMGEMVGDEGRVLGVERHPQVCFAQSTQTCCSLSHQLLRAPCAPLMRFQHAPSAHRYVLTVAQVVIQCSQPVHCGQSTNNLLFQEVTLLIITRSTLCCDVQQGVCEFVSWGRADF